MTALVRLFIVYDSRAVDDPHFASIMCTTESLAQAKSDAPEFGLCVIYSYAVSEGELSDQRYEWADPKLTQKVSR